MVKFSILGFFHGELPGKNTSDMDKMQGKMK
jgi:hypothetical protein